MRTRAALRDELAESDQQGIGFLEQTLAWRNAAEFAEIENVAAAVAKSEQQRNAGWHSNGVRGTRSWRWRRYRRHLAAGRRTSNAFVASWRRELASGETATVAPQRGA